MKSHIKHRLSLLSTLLLRARYSLEAPPLKFGNGSITDPSQADARGMGYIIDDEDEEDDGSYWK